MPLVSSGRTGDLENDLVAVLLGDHSDFVHQLLLHRPLLDFDLDLLAIPRVDLDGSVECFELDLG